MRDLGIGAHAHASILLAEGVCTRNYIAWGGKLKLVHDHAAEPTTDACNAEAVDERRGEGLNSGVHPNAPESTSSRTRTRITIEQPTTSHAWMMRFITCT